MGNHWRYFIVGPPEAPVPIRCIGAQVDAVMAMEGAHEVSRGDYDFVVMETPANAEMTAKAVADLCGLLPAVADDAPYGYTWGPKDAPEAWQWCDVERRSDGEFLGGTNACDELNALAARVAELTTQIAFLQCRLVQFAGPHVSDGEEALAWLNEHAPDRLPALLQLLAEDNADVHARALEILAKLRAKEGDHHDA